MLKNLPAFIGIPCGLCAGIAFLWLLPSGTYRAIAADTNTVTSDGYQLVEWVDLIPQDDLAALLSPPSSLDDIVDGSGADSLDNLDESTGQSDYGKALQSTRIIPEFDGKKIRIPGFVVPIESDDEQRITSFFLVPYFGACLHMPPPPPNQIIYGKYKEGFEVEVLYNPFWIEGTVKTEIADTVLGTSAYSMDVDKIEDYDY